MSQETKLLRRTMRDVVALSALPAAWVKLEPLQIAESLADVLEAALGLEFVYLQLQGADERVSEVARTRGGKRVDPAEIGRALAPILKLGARDSGLSLKNPVGQDAVRCVRIPIRWETGEWILVAASERPAFPTIEDRLTLSVSTNHAAMMLARNSAEASLRESESRYRSVVAAMQEGIMLLAADGTVRSCNAAGERILGVKEERIRGRKPLEPRGAIHDDGTRFARGEYPAPITLHTGQRCSNVVMGLSRPDGGVTWISVNTEPLYDTESQVLSGVVASFVDITARRRTEEALRDSEHRWRSLTEALPQLVWTCDLSGATTYMSAQWREFAGVPESELLGWGWSALLHPEGGEPTLARWRASVRECRAFEIEHRLRRADGAYRWFQSRSRPVRDATGTVTMWLGTSTDVSELRLAREAAEAANRAKDEFLANVSHEIRTPMNAILGMTELTLDSEIGSEQRDWLRTVKSAGDNLLGIIDSLLDFAKVAANKLELERAELSLRAELADILRALAVRAHRKGIELVGDVADEVPDRVLGDAGRLRQILINLIGNAIKFTQQGEVVVTVGADARAGEEVTLRFVVRDTGIGIPRDKHALIFEAFKQEDTSTTRRYGGTGLGLTIASRLAELMQGSIAVESETGKGSTFTFTARLGRGQDPEVPPFAPPPRLRVLVVDDNKISRDTLERWLQSWQLEVTAVADGLSALDALWHGVASARRYRLVLLDASMPGVDGAAVAVQIRERSELDGVGILMMMSGDRSPDNGRAKYADISVRKPLLKTELADALARFLDEDAAQDPLAENPRPAVAGPPRPPSRQGVPLRILVAEDNDFNAELVQELLRRRGHHPQIVASGNDVLARLESQQFDVLLLDLHMPGLDGFQVIERIRARERASGGHLPVIALTARSRSEDRDRCLAAGMDGFLAKPIDRNALFAEIERLAPQDAWVDARVLLAACGGDAEILEALKNAVREYVPRALARVQDAFHCRDALALREAAHGLLGMVATVSSSAGRAASAVEDAAADGALARAGAALEEVKAVTSSILAGISGVTLDRLEALADRGVQISVGSEAG